MWEKIRVVFTIPELRKKILFTLMLLAVFRVGSHIPLPIFNQEKLAALFDTKGGGGLFEQMSVFSGTNLGQATIFGLGIMPYISASIIFQLLASVYPPLEKLQKEGETGRKKINEYTRYATVFLCLGQSWFYVLWLSGNKDLVNSQFQRFENGVPLGMQWSWIFVAVITMTAGTIFLMWLGEQIDEYGIGNGISLLIMGNILARLPTAIYKVAKPIIAGGGLELGSGRGQMGVEMVLMLIVLFVGVIVGVVLISQGQRRIPTQSAKHVRGRRVYGGTRQYLPLRVNQAGVMPIIFASSLLLFPMMIFQYLAQKFHQRLAGDAGEPVPPRRVILIQPFLRGPDLLLLLFLDRHYFQSQGHGRQPEELWQFHSRLSARPPYGRLPGKGHGPHHLCGGGLPFYHRDHSLHCFVEHECRLVDRGLLRRHEPADRRERGLRPGAEDR